MNPYIVLVQFGRDDYPDYKRGEYHVVAHGQPQRPVSMNIYEARALVQEMRELHPHNRYFKVKV